MKSWPMPIGGDAIGEPEAGRSGRSAVAAEAEATVEDASARVVAMSRLVDRSTLLTQFWLESPR